MPDGLSVSRPVAVRLGLTALGFLLAGAAGGVLWERLWNPTAGLAYQDTCAPG